MLIFQTMCWDMRLIHSWNYHSFGTTACFHPTFGPWGFLAFTSFFWSVLVSISSQPHVLTQWMDMVQLKACDGIHKSFINFKSAKKHCLPNLIQIAECEILCCHTCFVDWQTYHPQITMKQIIPSHDVITYRFCALKHSTSADNVATVMDEACVYGHLSLIWI